MADLYLKRASTRPIEAYLQDGNGAALTMTGAVVKFQMRKKSESTLKIDRAAVIVNATTAHVRVTPTATDTDTPGNYVAEWRVSYAGGDVIVPENGYLSVRVWEDLA